ncbi:hypothetical protein [Nocardia niigatensis]|uniref:hypothetical protein n=1 Tax=Nocardia niigatensis TaxID=209249 RepID=UPI0012F63632|nr:hypothetical protein [Nocardia niigatensis]
MHIATDRSLSVKWGSGSAWLPDTAERKTPDEPQQSRHRRPDIERRPATPMWIMFTNIDDLARHRISEASTDSGDRLVDSWCSAGGQMTYVRTNVPMHVTAGLAGVPARCG